MFIPDLDLEFYPSRIPDPGIKKCTVSCNTVYGSGAFVLVAISRSSVARPIGIGPNPLLISPSEESVLFFCFKHYLFWITQIEEKVKEAAEISMGTEISEEDILNIKHLCLQIVEIQVRIPLPSPPPPPPQITLDHDDNQ